mmetsp:Transcript_78396/g.239814  ORF Transcript_78396/g.239814 Transcript_78396/m.239814 type:complete len:222 (+) Transcript_78396:636-1301(+)
MRVAARGVANGIASDHAGRDASADGSPHDTTSVRRRCWACRLRLLRQRPPRHARCFRRLGCCACGGREGCGSGSVHTGAGRAGDPRRDASVFTVRFRRAGNIACSDNDAAGADTARVEGVLIVGAASGGDGAGGIADTSDASAASPAVSDRASGWGRRRAAGGDSVPWTWRTARLANVGAIGLVARCPLRGVAACFARSLAHSASAHAIGAHAAGAHAACA